MRTEADRRACSNQGRLENPGQEVTPQHAAPLSDEAEVVGFHAGSEGGQVPGELLEQHWRHGHRAPLASDFVVSTTATLPSTSSTVWYTLIGSRRSGVLAGRPIMPA